MGDDLREFLADQVQMAGYQAPPKEWGDLAAQRAQHQEAVKEAIENGEEVPSAVLAEYPGIADEVAADKAYPKAVKLAKKTDGKVTVSGIQRSLEVNYEQAQRIMGRLREDGHLTSAATPPPEPTSEGPGPVADEISHLEGQIMKDPRYPRGTILSIQHQATMGHLSDEQYLEELKKFIAAGTTSLPPEPSAGLQKPPEAAAPPVVPPNLPVDLAKSKPRYGYRDRNFELKFDDARDLALYTVAQEKPNKAHDRFMEFLRGTFPGESDEQIVYPREIGKAKNQRNCVVGTTGRSRPTRAADATSKRGHRRHGGHGSYAPSRSHFDAARGGNAPSRAPRQGPSRHRRNVNAGFADVCDGVDDKAARHRREADAARAGTLAAGEGGTRPARSGGGRSA